MFSDINLYYIQDDLSLGYFIVKTKSIFSKFKYNKINNKKDTPIKQLLMSGTYKVELIKIFKSISKQDIDKEITFYLEHYKTIKRLEHERKLEELRRDIPIIKSSKDNDLSYGLSREQANLTLIQKVFQDNSISKSHYQFCKWDFVGQDFFYELKSYTYSVTKYNFMGGNVMPVDKGLCDNMIFLLETTEENNRKELHFIRYTYDLFKTFKQSYIPNPNRSGKTLCFRIPPPLLIRIDTSKTYKQIPVISIIEKEIRNKLIEKDKMYLVNNIPNTLITNIIEDISIND